MLEIGKTGKFPPGFDLGTMVATMEDLVGGLPSTTTVLTLTLAALRSLPAALVAHWSETDIWPSYHPSFACGQQSAKLSLLRIALGY